MDTPSLIAPQNSANFPIECLILACASPDIHHFSCILARLSASSLTALSLTVLSLTASTLVYNFPVLALAHAAMRLAVWLFLIGSAGSLLVIVISFAEDLHELLGRD
jgi:hypothetical protein